MRSSTIQPNKKIVHNNAKKLAKNNVTSHVINKKSKKILNKKHKIKNYVVNAKNKNLRFEWEMMTCVAPAT